MRTWAICGVLATALLPRMGDSSTLIQLSLDDMIRKSTLIVRGTTQPSITALHGSAIYTHYRVQVSEVWKGAAGASIDLAVPGGASSGMRQTYSGAPSLTAGKEYILFLWTGRSGLTQVIGLSQGLFDLKTNAQGITLVTRAASAEPMLNAAGQMTTDSDIQMPLAEFRARVAGRR